jgi:outer membrane immunogenic protein
MFKLNKIAGSVIAVAAITGSAGVALADGYVPKGKVAYERPTNWSGFYFGVQSGYAWSDIEVSEGGGAAAVDQATPIVGTHLGLQHQFGAVVLGVEGAWKAALIDDAGSTDCPNPAFECTARFRDVLTIGGRIGWAAGHWMPYLTGGYASARFEHESIDKATNLFFRRMNTRNDGWYLGGGVEWAVSPGWTAGLEYRHYELDTDTDVVLHAGGGFTPAGVRFLDPSLDTVTARVSWRWGRPEPKPLK